MRDADLALVNLECAITSSLQQWKGEPKAFYFGAPLSAVNALSDAGIYLVSLANNHILDFEFQGLVDTLRQLHAQAIANAGAGADVARRWRRPSSSAAASRFAMVAMCDHQADFAASADTTGHGLYRFCRRNRSAGAYATRRSSRCATPAPTGRSCRCTGVRTWCGSRRYSSGALRTRAIDMGWKILFGHSAHIFQGVEFFRGCPILYAAGDLVDDYAVDPVLRNDHQLLFEIELDRHAVQRIVLHPVLIADCQARPATGTEYDFIAKRITALCDAMGYARSTGSTSNCGIDAAGNL